MRFRLVLAALGLLVVVVGPVGSGAVAQQGVRGWLGARLQDLSEQSVKALGLTQRHAIMVLYPLSGGPAERGGLQPGDVIVDLNAKPVTTAQDFVSAVQQLGPGKEMRFGLWRRGERLTLAVTLTSSADASRLMASPQFAEQDLERKIEAYEAILAVFTRGRFPELWATTHNDLGVAYTDRIRGDRADDLEKAIAHLETALTVRTREALPAYWAQTHDGLGVAYQKRIRGDRADNLEKAIAAYEAALAVYTRKALPTDWARTQYNLSIAYADRIRGENADNLEKAIGHVEAALTVFTREALPAEWARSQNNLAIAYWRRIRGKRADNLEKAIASHEAAITVFTREALPGEWATIQHNLGLAYAERIRGERVDNLEKAIAHLEAALTVRTQESMPTDWARTQHNLGLAYTDRVRGERVNNLEKAIAHLEAALTIHTREALPADGAQTQTNLAFAYWVRIRGERADNLDKAIAHLEAALTVHTREAMPRQHLGTGHLLGRVLLDRHDWKRSSTALLSARDAFLLLFGEGLNEVEAGGLIDIARSLFRDAAFAAAQAGDAEQALSLLSQGRARLMVVALRQQGLTLSEAQRMRHQALRVEIRQLQQAVDATSGLERITALGRLTSLRSELSELVKSGLAHEAPGGAMAQLDSVLSAGSALVAPIATEHGGKLLVVTRAEGRAKLDIVDLPQLTTARVDQLMRGAPDKRGGWLGAFALQNDHARYSEWLSAINGVGPQLWQMLGGAVHKALSDRGIRPGARLLWMPPGNLGLLPMGLARDGAKGQPLGDLYEMVSVPSLEVLAAAAKQIGSSTQPRSLTAVVNPTGDLPFTETESALVAGRFPASARTSLVRAAARPEAVLAALKGRSYWHFSSHGTFSWDDARQSALLMHDREPLSVGRLLETEGLGRPRLVVLSACETGLYAIDRNPEEFVGLPATFMQIGAAGVLGTLWQVDDMATALLVAKVYDLHLGGGELPSAALRHAQAWLRDATKADLIAFAKGAGQRAGLDAARLAELEGGLTSRHRSGNARFARAWELLQAEPAEVRSEKGGQRPARLREKPFAHPYYWGGFVYTGL